MSEKRRLWWCQCLHDFINYHMNIDRAKGILAWSKEKGYKKMTSGARGALSDSLKNLQNVTQKCEFSFEGNREAQEALIEANNPANSPEQALKLLSDADRYVREAVGRQCRDEFSLYYEATRGKREKAMAEWREMRAGRGV